LQSIVDELREKNVEIIAISADPIDRLDELVEKKGYTFPLVSDTKLKAINAIGLRHPNGSPIGDGDIARPAMFLLDQNQKIVWEEYPDNWRKRPTADDIIRNVELGYQGSGY